MQKLWWILLSICLTASACPDKTMTVGFNHVRTSQGYINHGLRKIGTLFLLDRKAGTFRRLETISIRKSDLAPTEPPTTIKAKVESGFKIVAKAKVTKAIEIEVQNKIESNASYELTNGIREEIAKPIRPLNLVLLDQLNKNRKLIEREWLIQTASRDQKNYKYIFITEVIRADKAHFKFGNTTTAGGKITIATKGGEVEVTLKQVLDDKFEGKKIPVIFDVAPLKLVLVECPKDKSQACAQFKQDTKIDRTKLTDILSRPK